MSAARHARVARLAFAGALPLVCALAVIGPSRPALAEKVDKAEKAVCLDAMSKGQTLRDAHRLLEARDRFRMCSRQVCPTLVQNDCGGWLAEVERAVPTVVVTARSSAGGDLFAVKVSMDATPLVGSLDGQAIPLNPGLHSFHFESEGMRAADTQVLVKEGGKDQSVAVVMTPVTAPTVMTTTVQTKPASSGSALRTTGYVLGGIGIAGLATGIAAGVIATSAKSSDCKSDVCKPGTSSTVQTDAHISTIGFIAGGALLAAGIGLVVFAPRSSSAHPETALRLVPIYTGGASGGIGVGGSF